MKKIIAAIFAAVLTTTGLVTFSGTSATAATCERYGNCPRPAADVSIPRLIELGASVPVTITIAPEFAKSAARAVRPKGTVRVIYKRNAGGFFKARNVYYSGRTKTIRSPRFTKLGRHTVTIRFIPRKGSPYRRSSDRVRVNVVDNS